MQGGITLSGNDCNIRRSDEVVLCCLLVVAYNPLSNSVLSSRPDVVCTRMHIMTILNTLY
jgi:hypothetical protein